MLPPIQSGLLNLPETRREADDVTGQEETSPLSLYRDAANPDHTTIDVNAHSDFRTLEMATACIESFVNLSTPHPPGFYL